VWVFTTISLILFSCFFWKKSCFCVDCICIYSYRLVYYFSFMEPEANFRACLFGSPVQPKYLVGRFSRRLHDAPGQAWLAAHGQRYGTTLRAASLTGAGTRLPFLFCLGTQLLFFFSIQEPMCINFDS
jgi:hypothetical protein